MWLPSASHSSEPVSATVEVVVSLEEPEHVADGQLYVVVGEVGERVPVDENGLLLVEDGAEESTERLDTGALQGIHDDLMHPVSAGVADQGSGRLRVEVPARLPDHPRMVAGVTDVRNGHSDLASERNDAPTR